MHATPLPDAGVVSVYSSWPTSVHVERAAVASTQSTSAVDKCCDVVLSAVVWCGVVMCGVVWCGVVMCGVVMCGVVMCGPVFIIFRRERSIII